MLFSRWSAAKKQVHRAACAAGEQRAPGVAGVRRLHRAVGELGSVHARQGQPVLIVFGRIISMSGGS